MARVTNKEVLADRQDASQPHLFDDEQVPVCLPVLEAVRSRAYEHQGVRLLEDESKALRLVELITSRWGVKKISREMHISVHTVRAARRALELQGKMAPYKLRLAQKMEDVIEAGVDAYLDAVESGRVNGRDLPVGIGIISDKRALLLGEPTSISTTAAAQTEELSVDAINAYLASLKVAKPGDKDSQSSGNGENHPKNQGADV